MGCRRLIGLGEVETAVFLRSYGLKKPTASHLTKKVVDVRRNAARTRRYAEVGAVGKYSKVEVPQRYISSRFLKERNSSCSGMIAGAELRKASRGLHDREWYFQGMYVEMR